MKTIRTANLGKLELRLVEKDKKFSGIVVGGGANRPPIEGDNADDVWRRLHDEAAKANPKYAGFDGARNRFLHFFPGGFRSAGFAEHERALQGGGESQAGFDRAPRRGREKHGLGRGDPGRVPRDQFVVPI